MQGLIIRSAFAHANFIQLSQQHAQVQLDHNYISVLAISTDIIAMNTFYIHIESEKSAPQCYCIVQVAIWTICSFYSPTCKIKHDQYFEMSQLQQSYTFSCIAYIVINHTSNRQVMILLFYCTSLDSTVMMHAHMHQCQISMFSVSLSHQGLARRPKPVEQESLSSQTK